MYQSKGKRLGFKLLIVLTVIAALLGGIYFLLSTYTVKTVYVEGNVHYTQEEIEAIVMDGPLGDNSLYLSLKYSKKGVENIPFVDVMDVSILSPDTIKITVYEKALAGFVEYMDTYMYFDKDGYVVECSGVMTVGVPQIAGLDFNHVVLGEQLPVEDVNVFNRILELTKLLNKYELAADKIYFHTSREISIFFGNIRVALGSDNSRLEEKIMRLPKFLGDLAGKSGTLRMENFTEDNTIVPFQPDGA